MRALTCFLLVIRIDFTSIGSCIDQDNFSMAHITRRIDALLEVSSAIHQVNSPVHQQHVIADSPAAIAPYRYRVEGDVDGAILNGLARRAAGLPVHLRHEFALEFRRKVTTHDELRVVTLEDLARNHATVWKEEDESLLAGFAEITEAGESRAGSQCYLSG